MSGAPVAFGARIAPADDSVVIKATDAVSVGLGSPPAFPVRNQKSIGFSMLSPPRQSRVGGPGRVWQSEFRVLGFRCHVELDAETVLFDYVSITCRLRLVYVSFTCFTAEYPQIYLLKKFAYVQFL